MPAPAPPCRFGARSSFRALAGADSERHCGDAKLTRNSNLNSSGHGSGSRTAHSAVPAARRPKLETASGGVARTRAGPDPSHSISACGSPVKRRPRAAAPWRTGGARGHARDGDGGPRPEPNNRGPGRVRAGLQVSHADTRRRTPGRAGSGPGFGSTSTGRTGPGPGRPAGQPGPADAPGHPPHPDARPSGVGWGRSGERGARAQLAAASIRARGRGGWRGPGQPPGRAMTDCPQDRAIERS